MRRTGWTAAFVAAGIAIAAAQTPKGWMVRADRSTSASDPDAQPIACVVCE